MERAKETARKVRNPRTGESIDLAASTVPYFKPGKILRDVVKSIKSSHIKKLAYNKYPPGSPGKAGGFSYVGIALEY